MEDGGGGRRLYITNEASVHLSCGWVAEEKEEKNEKKGGGGYKEGERKDNEEK